MRSQKDVPNLKMKNTGSQPLKLALTLIREIENPDQGNRTPVREIEIETIAKTPDALMNSIEELRSLIICSK